MLRRIYCALGILAVSTAAVLAVRGAQKPYAPDAPPYRQKGPAGAAVIVVEFSDFQCPACRFAVDPLKRLEALENWRAGVETLSARQWRLQLIAVSAALTVVGSLVVALILALARG